MKEVSSRLDNFTKKMQETEIPKQAEAVQELLILHVINLVLFVNFCGFDTCLIHYVIWFYNEI